MEQQAIRSLIKIYNSNEGLLNAAQTGNVQTLTQVLIGAGVTSPTLKDLQDAQDLASGFDSRKDKDEAERKAERAKQMAYDAYGNVVREVMMTDPKTRAIYAILTAAGEGADVTGDILENDGNKLAQAILAAGRTNTQRQNEVFGPSRREQAAEMWAAERQRRGNNSARIAHGVGNVIKGVLGQYQAEDAAARQRMMAPYDMELGMPGNYWQAQSQAEKRAWQSANNRRTK